MEIGIFKGKGRVHHEQILQTLIKKDSMIIADISRAVAEELTKNKDASTYEVSKSLSARYASKDGPIDRLHLMGYIGGKNIEKDYDRAPVYITLKGVFALLSNFDDYSNICNYYDFKTEIDYGKIKKPIIRFNIVGFYEELDYFYLYVTMIMPIKPILHIWKQLVDQTYYKTDLDNIPIDNLRNKLIESEERVMSIIVYMMLKDGVISLYFEDDLGIVLSRCKDWINKFGNKPINKSLLENRLCKRKQLTRYEKTIINLADHWEDTRQLAKQFNMRL